MVSPRERREMRADSDDDFLMTRQIECGTLFQFTRAQTGE
jgi:hypothetical protein